MAFSWSSPGESNTTISTCAAVKSLMERILILRLRAASIEEAARKRKIKIRSINDFTAAQVEIVVLLSPGEDQEKAIAAFYHFTQCEVTIHSNIVVIKRERPVQMDVEEVIRFNTEQLVSLLKQELELRRNELQDDLHWKSLIQLFIENRIYKRIEECETYEDVRQAVLNGLQSLS